MDHKKSRARREEVRLDTHVGRDEERIRGNEDGHQNPDKSRRPENRLGSPGTETACDEVG